MGTFQYTARDARGQETRGELDAPTWEEARQELVGRGLTIVSLQRLGHDPEALKPPVRLSAGESSEFAEQVAHVSASKLPMAPALRAAAEQWGPGRVRDGLLWVAGLLDQGQSLEGILKRSDTFLAPHVARLLLQSLKAGVPGDSLLALTGHQQAMRSFRQQLRGGFMYPLIVLGLAIALLLFMVIYVSGAVQEMARGFDIQLPLITRILFWWRETGLVILGGLLLLGALGVLLLRLLLDRAARRRLLASLPLFGPLVSWAGVADWAGLMSLLLRQGLSLPEALRVAGRGAYDAEAARVSDQLADGVARGRKLWDLMRAEPTMPATLLPLLQWGESQNAVAEAMHIGGTMLQQNARSRALMLQSVLPPFLFIFIGLSFLFVITAQFAPLIQLISRLS